MATQRMKKADLIGKRIRCVYHINLPYDQKEDFQERLIVVELETGLRLSLRQEPVINQQTGKASIARYMGSSPLETVIDGKTDTHANSPIKSIIVPYRWNTTIGLMLDNGYALHEGYSMWDNGAVLYLPKPEVIGRLQPIEMEE